MLLEDGRGFFFVFDGFVVAALEQTQEADVLVEDGADPKDAERLRRAHRRDELAFGLVCSRSRRDRPDRDALAPVFGGVNLEDISSPRCFEIERRLRETLDIPVFHDDQHGTAIVVLAGLINALRVVGKTDRGRPDRHHGRRRRGNRGGEDAARRRGPRHRRLRSQGRRPCRPDDLDAVKREFAQPDKPSRVTGSADDALQGADVFIGLSFARRGERGGDSRRWPPAPIVFAMANPTPEVLPEEIEGDVAVIATGRSDYPNQINNVLAFPGVFRGALDVRASTINDEMELAAAHAIADVVDAAHLAPDYVIPSVFNRDVATAVANAVAEAAIKPELPERKGGRDESQGRHDQETS